LVPCSQVAARFDGRQEAHRARITELEGKIADAKKREAERQEGWKGKVSSVGDG
jgi:BMFP domain-containing protein YqiC